MEETLSDSINFTLLISEGLILQISRVCFIINTFLLIVCGFNSHKNIFVFYDKNRQK